MWFWYAFASALGAALAAIFGKLGLKNLDPTLATSVRAILMAVFLVVVSIFIGKWRGVTLESFSNKEWLFLALSALAGALSWLAYFFALSAGPVAGVTAIDKLSIILTIIFAGIFLSETISWASFLGAILMIFGAILIAVPIEKVKTFFGW